MKIKIGDKIVECEMKDGVPVVKANAEEIRHPDGRVDVIVRVPSVKLRGKTIK